MLAPLVVACDHPAQVVSAGFTPGQLPLSPSLLGSLKQAASQVPSQEEAVLPGGRVVAAHGHALELPRQLVCGETP